MGDLILISMTFIFDIVLDQGRWRVVKCVDLAFEEEIQEYDMLVFVMSVLLNVGEEARNLVKFDPIN